MYSQVGWAQFFRAHHLFMDRAYFGGHGKTVPTLHQLPNISLRWTILWGREVVNHNNHRMIRRRPAQ